MTKQDNQSASEMTLETILNNPVDKKILDGYIQEINIWQSKIRENREGIKDILTEAKEKLGIKGSLIRKLAKSYEDPSIATEQSEEWDSIQQAIEELKS